jgi:hypothetical protein
MKEFTESETAPKQQCLLPNLDFNFSLKNKQRNFNEFKGGGIKNTPLSQNPTRTPGPLR